MKILIISNPKVEEFIDDQFIAKEFEKDGHTVKLVDKFYPEELDSQFDIFLKRNSWRDDEEDFCVHRNSDDFKKRIISKDLPRINYDGKFDGAGKDYLCDLYKNGYEVVPTVRTPIEVGLLPESEIYLLKPKSGWDGFGIKKCTKQNFANEWTNDYVIQPKLDFASEVQFYFVGNSFEYALEFAPNKYPDYPDPTTYPHTESELKLAKSFADLSPNYNGVQRIDFLKLKTGELKMLEIEDSSPDLNLKDVPIKLKNKFVKDYKNLVYKYFQTWQTKNAK